MTKEILDVIEHLEKAAMPGPWTSVGHELYYGEQKAGVIHQQLSYEPNARLIAVLRSWAPELIALARKGLAK